IFALDATGRVVTWNPGAEAIKGWRADEIIGQHFSAFYPPDDVLAGKPEAELRAAATFGRFEDEGWRVRRDGSRFWANVIITALRAPDGELRGFAKVTRDFTERRASEELRRQLVVETAAREAAQAAVAKRDEFLAVAGHELRTPLTALLFQTEALARGAGTLPPEAAARVSKLARSARRIARLVDDLLDVTRISVGRLTLERETVDLSELARDVVARHAEPGAAEASSLRLDAPRPVEGSWDPERIEQILEALVSNALKYGRGQPIDVRVESDGLTARIVVRDRGIGIAPEDQARVFERFERAASARHYGGLGLGLWIVRQVTEAHGGRIRVASRVGAGSTFTVELPLGAGAS
ncbi:MAG TPA: PAS domain-containing sensor histidine kinase, partial [Anaeromyxobacter sp.]|nr:PAS domain-containing sensor histidine kinase [Anaeromyxobacter sp.]